MAAVVLLISTPCFAQYSASIQGTVTDPAGAVVPSAAITLTNLATNITDKTATNGTGSYSFANLLPGDYRIEVVAAGFERYVITRHVSTDEVAGVNAVLTVGGESSTVTVTAEEAALNPDETRIQYTLQSKDINNMPLPDRATLTTLRVAPGVVGTIETSGSTNTNIPIGQATPDARANGRPAASNVYLLDRIPIGSTENPGSINMVPNPDMLAEIALQATSYSVENGATSSLQVDMTSKSGGAKYHGDFDFNYSSKPFEANPDFGATSPFHRKYYMGSFGGPISKHHTFFFGSVERIDNLSASGAVVTEFSAAGIGAWAAKQFPNAAFNKMFTFPADNLANQKVNSVASDYYPANGSQRFGVTCGTASAFNLPCNTPVTISGNFNQNPGITGQQYNLRFDQSLRGDNDRFYIGYFGLQQNSAYVDPRSAFDTKTPSQTYYFSAGWSHIISATMTNQLNVGLNRIWFGGAANPNYAIFPHATLFSFMSDAGGVGFAGGPQESPDSPYIGADSKEHILALRDYVSWMKGRHEFTFGFQSSIRNYWQNSSANYSRPFGMYFSDLLEMLQGEPDEYSLYTIGAATGKWISQVYGAQQVQFGAYAEDQWKIKPNFQVTFGLRWDDFGNPGPYGDGAAPYSNTLLGTGSSLYAQVSGASAQLVSNAFRNGQTWNFMPRASFSWTPAQTRGLVVRGGVGLYQDAINLNQITANLPTTTPVRLTLTLHDNAEVGCPSNCGFFNYPWSGKWTGVTGVPGEPNPTGITGTQGTTAPYGIPYPSIPVTGFTSRGLAEGPGGLVYSSDMYGVDPNLKPQSTILYGFGVEKELPNSIVVGADYSGSYSYNQFLDSNSFDNPPSAINATRPWAQVGKVALIQNMLTSNYNALILTARQRKGAASWEASYLWSHSLGNPGTGDNPSPYNPTAAYGTTNLDVPQRLTFDGSYQLPAGESFLTKGWSLGGVFIAQDGTPFTVYSSQDVNGDGNKDGSNDLPNVVFQPTSGLHYGKYARAQYKAGIFNACGGGSGASGSLYDSVNYPGCPFQSVTNPNSNTLEGNEPYNAFRNPGYWDMDVNLQKKIETPWFGDEKGHLNLRFEAMNLFNHANLGGFGTSIIIGSTSNFGQITQAQNPRIMQIGGRFEF